MAFATVLCSTGDLRRKQLEFPVLKLMKKESVSKNCQALKISYRQDKY